MTRVSHAWIQLSRHFCIISESWLVNFSNKVLLQHCLLTQQQQFEMGELLSPPDILNKLLDRRGSNPSRNDNFTWEAMQFVTFSILTKSTDTLLYYLEMKI